ncbi:hypothetical protein MPH_13696, partial [Macrophomina phaseolina MS6]
AKYEILKFIITPLSRYQGTIFPIFGGFLGGQLTGGTRYPPAHKRLCASHSLQNYTASLNGHVAIQQYGYLVSISSTIQWSSGIFIIDDRSPRSNMFLLVTDCNKGAIASIDNYSA